MLDQKLLTFIGSLTDLAVRPGATKKLAQALGADDLILFTRDPALGMLLPAPGFPQTLPKGREWQTFLKACSLARHHVADLESPYSKTAVRVVGLLAADGSVLALLGAAPNFTLALEVCILVPLLAAALQTERVELTAKGQIEAESKSTENAKALVAALDDTRRKLQASLLEADVQRQKFEALFAASPTGMALLRGPTFVFERINHAYSQLIEHRDVLGKELVDALPELEGQPFKAILDEVFATGKPYIGNEIKAYLQRKPAAAPEAGFFDCTFQRVDDSGGKPYGIHVNAIDVTEKVDAREKIAASESQFRTLAESIPQLAWSADGEGNISWYNQRWHDFTGKNLEEMRRWGWKTVHKSDDVERVLKEMQENWEKGEPWEGTYLLRKHTGEFRWFLTRAEPIKDAEGKVVRWFGTNTDVTEQRKVEDELTRAKELAESASQAKSAFVANMSHEIRNPLGALLGFGELLRDPELPAAERAEYVDIICRNGQTLLHLVDDVLDLSKVEAGQLNVERLDVLLPELLGDVITLLSGRAREKGLRLRVVSDGAVPDMVRTDPTRLRQILVNIIGNAIKYTATGEVTVTVKSSPESGTASPLLTFTVQDTGIGVSSAQQARLFQPFAQADSSTSRKFGGTGLGLALSRRLARALGGDVTLVRSRPEEGSTFQITIAAAPVPKAAAVQSPLSESQKNRRDAGGEDFSGLTVLVVDDAPDNQLLIERLLTRRGASVVVADNGLEGVKKALSGGIDLILMDIQMPELDGYSAVRRLRREGYTGPVVALTAHAMKEEEARCRSAGFDEHLAKPISWPLLYQTVARLGTTASTRVDDSYCDDDPEIQEILADAMRQLPDDVKDLRQACERANWKDVAALAHKVRGSVAAPRIPHFGRLAERIEAEARGDGARDGLPHYVAQLERLCASNGASLG